MVRTRGLVRIDISLLKLTHKTTEKMVAKSLLLSLFVLVVAIRAHPTMYKLNENAKLEPDLVPVSSTVIPLPIYQVGYGIDVAKGSKGQKTVIQKPEGPVTLVTVHSKKPLPVEKIKTSTVKEVKKEEFTADD